MTRVTEHVVAVDGGNSKTDVVLVSTTGRLLARVRGPGVRSPHGDTRLWAKKLTTLVDAARAAARIPATAKALSAVYYLANVDFPSERRVAQRELHAGDQALDTFVHNDTLAVLRAGASRPWGVAVVAGAGINAVGVHPSGRRAGFLALGYYTGDSGGGRDIGIQALALAVRAQDGRGRPTSLTTSVPAFYGLRNPEAVAIAVHHGEISPRDFIQLAPLVFAAAADGDDVATGILSDFADEVAAMAGALIRRLRLVRTDVEVVLGGGTLQTGDEWISERVQETVAAVAPAAKVRVLDVAPVFGAVVEAFERAGVPERATLAARRSLSVLPG
jgi:N-acetylglucosamine kinase-like BadF-type ATPase